MTALATQRSVQFSLYGLSRTFFTISDPQDLPAACYQEPAPLNPFGTEKHRDEDVSATPASFEP